jgi:shikimate dehydrogenase
MIKLGLIGYPLGHSLSPKIQTAALQSCGLEGSYSLFPVGPDDKQGLKNLLDRVRTGEITGINVTIPHKQHVIEFMDQLTPTAKSIGAVNTIYLREGKLIGDNTDAPGFMTDLNRFLTLECDSLLSQIQKEVLVLGAGGSARAVVYALSNNGWDISIASRRIEQAQELAAQFKSTNAIEFKFQTFKLSNFQLVINTTPLGMTPNIDQSPWPGEIPFPKDAAVYDLVYNPRETKLVRDARSQGLNATTGLGMLIGQAALAFELWTGHAVPRDVLWNATENQLLTTGD